MPQNETPARQGASGSGRRSAVELINPEFTKSSHISQADLSSALAVTDGGTTRGFIVQTKGAAIAVDPDGGIIGAFATTREAFRAISEQPRST
jgi:hypothetical protein